MYSMNYLISVILFQVFCITKFSFSWICLFFKKLTYSYDFRLYNSYFMISSINCKKNSGILCLFVITYIIFLASF